MKLLTKEEEAAHYRAVLQGGTFGTVVGLVGGWAGVMMASRRFHTIRNLTLPMKAFLVTSSGTFVGIIAADHSSRQFEAARNVKLKYLGEREERLRREELSQMSFGNRITAWARFDVSGDVCCAAFEIQDQRRGQGLLEAAKKGREAVKETKNQPAEHHNQRHDENTDLWEDMVAAEEQKLKLRHKSLYSHEEKKGAVTEAINAKKEEAKEDDKEKKEEKKEESEEETK
uniref:Respiratory supercomplex factor 2 like n=1 Tax=Talaromyces marneffei PM1 TaxID=1077442 RepID=A0A093UMK3_TALMA